MTNINYTLKHGTIDEILCGEGERVKNYEELWHSGKDKTGLFIPKIIGVYQAENTPENELYLNFEEMTDNFFEKTYGEKEKIEPNLISIIYDPDAMNKDLIKMSLSKDISSRISAFDYKNAPEFKNKSFMEDQRMINEVYEEDKEKFEKAYEIGKSDKENYGLTKKEQMLFYAISKMNDLNNNSNLIKDPETTKLIYGIINGLEDFL